jgi:Acyl-protein synthetase, LuxE
MADGAYATPQPRKAATLVAALSELTAHHRAACPPYGRIVDAVAPGFAGADTVADVPHLPVSLFKTHELRSIPREAVFKTLTSSGTTGQQPSRVFLDRESAAAQTRTLSATMQHWLGPQRLPMVIVDTRSVLKDRAEFSARGAGILGMAPFGRDHLYLLDADAPQRAAWLAKHDGSPVLVFGFTSMVWQHLPAGLDLRGGVLVHSGGWKRLTDQAVTPAAFREEMRARTAIERVHNFYGMAEQTGTVYVECEHGALHAPDSGDVVIRDPVTWRPAPRGQTGVVEVVSTLPRSYPGHALLTEDLGRVVAVDDCPCGRLGQAIEISGRVPKAELRGCSDTAAVVA